MRESLIFSVLALLMMRNVPAYANDCEKHPATLAAMQDCYRPLLLIAPSGSDTRLKEQLAELQQHASALRERDVMVVVLSKAPPELTGSLPIARLTEQDAAAARKQFGLTQKEFAVVLVGKDGGEKFRQSSVLTAARLSQKIDGMPMRQDEMRQK